MEESVKIIPTCALCEIRQENESLKALLREAADAMEFSYDVRDWPGSDGTMGQVLKKIHEKSGCGDDEKGP